MNTTIAGTAGAARDTKPLTYQVTLTDGGKWMHSPGSDFVFAYVDDKWKEDVTKAVAAAFISARTVSTAIKKAVLDMSGQAVVNGLYLLDQPAMTTAMNSIPGMGETGADQGSKRGSGTALSITGEFFGAVLGGLGGDVGPLLNYLTTKMGDVQAETREQKSISTFGTMVGLVSVMPVLNVVTTSFQYVYSSQETSSWFVKVNCGSAENQAYDYTYTVVDYDYSVATA